MRTDPAYDNAIPASASSYKWWVIGMLWIICLSNYAQRYAISAILPKLHDEFGFDKDIQGYIGSACLWVYAAGSPFAGYIGDRVRRKTLILGGCIFWSVVTVMTSGCTAIWQFITVRALEGLGETFYFPAAMSLISDYHSSQTRSRAMSIHQSSVYVGTIAGSWIAAWFAEHYNWRWGFYLFGGMGIAAAALFYFLLREPRRGQSEANPGKVAIEAAPAGVVLKQVFTTPTAVLLLLAFMGANAVAGVFLLWTPSFLVDKFHFKLAAAGLSGSVYIQVASALSVPLGGMLADKLSRRHAGGRIWVQIMGLLIGSFFVFTVGHTEAVSTLIIAMSLFGLCKGLYDSNIFASLYDVVPAESRASAAGLMNTIGWGGGALSTALFGWLAKNGKYGSEVNNESHYIALGGAIYLIAAALLILASFCARRDVVRA